MAGPRVKFTLDALQVNYKLSILSSSTSPYRVASLESKQSCQSCSPGSVNFHSWAQPKKINPSCNINLYTS
jgi:hypothetical protein